VAAGDRDGEFGCRCGGDRLSQTVWFPLLRSYVEPGGIGRFFGTLRSGWHLTLIAYYLAAQQWLAAHPGSFSPLFAVATLCGLLRIVLVARLPDTGVSERDRIRARDVVAVLRHDPGLRVYLYGVGLCGAARRVVIPFAIVMMRRVLGLTESDVLLATVTYFFGGFVSLYLWGRLVDRFGPRPCFRRRGLGGGYLALFAALPATGAATMVIFFFAVSVLSAGFGVADTQALFELAPQSSPVAHLVIADVASRFCTARCRCFGILLDVGLGRGAPVGRNARCSLVRGDHVDGDGSVEKNCAMRRVPRWRKIPQISQCTPESGRRICVICKSVDESH
jgi:hypothetical protein